MNLYVVIGVAIGAVVAAAGLVYAGYDYGVSSEKANRLENEQVARTAYEAGQKGAAQAIADLGVRYVPVKATLEREIREKVVYRDCRHTPDGLRALNEAITGAKPAGDSQLPAASAPQ